MPTLQTIHEKYKPNGFKVVSIHSTGGYVKDEVDAYVEGRKIGWPLLVDKDSQSRKAWNVSAFPRYYLLDREGNILYSGLSSKDLDKAISLNLQKKDAG